MEKQSLFSPANSVLLQALKTIWRRTKFRNSFKLCYHTNIYSEDTDNSNAHKLANLQIWRNLLVHTFSAACLPNAEGLSLITELLMSSILILFFPCRFENLSIFITLFELTLPWQYALALHITRYNHLCHFFMHICRLDACQYTWR